MKKKIAIILTWSFALNFMSSVLLGQDDENIDVFLKKIKTEVIQKVKKENLKNPQAVKNLILFLNKKTAQFRNSESYRYVEDSKNENPKNWERAFGMLSALSYLKTYFRAFRKRLLRKPGAEKELKSAEDQIRVQIQANKNKPNSFSGVKEMFSAVLGFRKKYFSKIKLPLRYVMVQGKKKIKGHGKGSAFLEKTQGWLRQPIFREKGSLSEAFYLEAYFGLLDLPTTLYTQRGGVAVYQMSKKDFLNGLRKLGVPSDKIKKKSRGELLIKYVNKLHSRIKKTFQLPEGSNLDKKLRMKRFKRAEKFFSQMWNPEKFLGKKIKFSSDQELFKKVFGTPTIQGSCSNIKGGLLWPLFFGKRSSGIFENKVSSLDQRAIYRLGMYHLFGKKREKFDKNRSFHKNRISRSDNSKPLIQAMVKQVQLKMFLFNAQLLKDIDKNKKNKKQPKSTKQQKGSRYARTVLKKTTQGRHEGLDISSRHGISKKNLKSLTDSIIRAMGLRVGWKKLAHREKFLLKKRILTYNASKGLKKALAHLILAYYWELYRQKHGRILDSVESCQRRKDIYNILKSIWLEIRFIEKEKKEKKPKSPSIKVGNSKGKKKQRPTHRGTVPRVHKAR